MTDSPTLGESAAGREAAYAELLRLEADPSATVAPHDLPEIAVACAPMLCAVLCKDVAEVSVEEYRRACQVLTALSGVDPVRVGGECTKLESACVAQCNIWTVWASAGSAVGVALAKDAAAMTSDESRADNSRGPGGPMGTLCTPLRTPRALSKPSITH